MRNKVFERVFAVIITVVVISGTLCFGVSATETELVAGKEFSLTNGISWLSPSLNLTDGNIYNFADWYGGDAYVDLGNQYIITRFVVDFRPSGQLSERNYIDFQVSDSENGEYTTIYSIGADRSDTQLVVEFSENEVYSGRFFKIARAEGNDGYNLLADIKIYGTDAPLPAVDISTGKPAKASGTGAGSPENANDGNPGSFWECDFSNLSNIWWQTDLGGNFKITKVIVTTRYTEQLSEKRNFEVIASNDPKFGTYVVIGEQGNEAIEGTSWTTLCNLTERYRYVRLRKTEAEYFLLPEIKIFGYPEDITVSDASYSQEVLDNSQDISFSANVTNNTVDDKTVSVLIVRTKNGVICDLAYELYPLNARYSEYVEVTLPAATQDNPGDCVKAYIFDNFENLYSIGELQRELK